jgi:hypothetical protein
MAAGDKRHFAPDCDSVSRGSAQDRAAYAAQRRPGGRLSLSRPVRVPCSSAICQASGGLLHRLVHQYSVSITLDVLMMWVLNTNWWSGARDLNPGPHGPEI